MIWTAGRILDDDELTVSVLDPTFEHGLGLFETLRTWNGRPALLGRHLVRMMRSARELGLPLEPSSLPDERAVAELLLAQGFTTSDAMLRITLSGASAVWMRAAPLPPPQRKGGAVLGDPWSVSRDDPLARHKSLNYWRRRLVYEAAVAKGCDEALSVSDDGCYWEGSRTNLFVVMGPILTTPHEQGPLVPGIMRAVVRERARALGIDVREGEISRNVFPMVEEAFLTNSVRGIVPLARLARKKLPAPGPLTQRLWDEVRSWLERGEEP
jgi:branched-subunit amino acid aminotransferase/4-amino-4-deoxychorismate lyase